MVYSLLDHSVKGVLEIGGRPDFLTRALRPPFLMILASLSYLAVYSVDIPNSNDYTVYVVKQRTLGGESDG